MAEPLMAERLVVHVTGELSLGYLHALLDTLGQFGGTITINSPDEEPVVIEPRQFSTQVVDGSWTGPWPNA